MSEVDAPEASFVNSIAQVYLKNDTNMKPVIRAVLLSPQFMDKRRYYQRYAWPVEFVVRSLKEVGYIGFSVDSALTPLLNMGQQLFEPPDVNGWDLGPGWFSTGGMLARMNFASTLATNQRFLLRDAARPASGTPESLLAFVRGRLSLPDLGCDDEQRVAGVHQGRRHVDGLGNADLEQGGRVVPPAHRFGRVPTGVGAVTDRG